ncbi:unnamed protein product [Arabidopsis halleri]
MCEKFHEIRNGQSPFPKVEDLKESVAYIDVAHKMIRAIGSVNMLTHLYERMIHNQGRVDDPDVRAALEAEKKRANDFHKKLLEEQSATEHLRKKVELLTAWQDELMGKLDQAVVEISEAEGRMVATKAQWAKDRDGQVRCARSKAYRDSINYYQGRLDILKSYFICNEAVLEPLLLHTQSNWTVNDRSSTGRQFFYALSAFEVEQVPAEVSPEEDISDPPEDVPSVRQNEEPGLNNQTDADVPSNALDLEMPPQDSPPESLFK